jgi:hypothetical protein
MSGLLRTYRELNASVTKFVSNKQLVDFEALKKSLLDLQGEIEAHFDAKKDRVLNRIESLLSAVQLKLVGINFERIANQSSPHKQVKRLKTVSCNRSYDLSDRKGAELFPASLMKTLKNHSQILRQSEVPVPGSNDAPQADLPNNSTIRGSQHFNVTTASFLGSFLPPFGMSASQNLPGEIEKDIAQSIHSYFQRERNWIESEKSKLEKEKSVFEDFRERELSTIKADFRKSVAKNTEQFEVVDETGSRGEFPDSSPRVFARGVSNRLSSEGTPTKTSLVFATNSPQKVAPGSETELPKSDSEISKRQMDALAKRITNLERQLRNRNKDYLFALKELEKVKGSIGKRDTPSDDSKFSLLVSNPA